MEYNINRGVAKTVEFRGLTSQYLLAFVIGLLIIFFVFVIMYMAGVSQWVCIGFGVVSATLLVWLTFRLNARYGTHGLMKLAANKRHTRRIINRRAIPLLFLYKKTRDEKYT